MPALAKGIESDPDNRPRVFISYSRVDKAQAEDLRDELIVGGFDAYLDAHDIEAGEPWKARLASLIANAEKVVFLISPSSIASEVCDWEIDEAERQAKGILPVLVRETKLETIPGRLTRLNFVFMTTTEEQNDNLPDLTRALSTDFEWEREKTEINDYAADWDSGGRSNRSLRFAEAKIAGWERWRDRHPPTAVAPTELHLTFITEARRVATQRQRRTVFAAISAAVVAVVLSIIAWTQREQAVENERRAEIERNTALTSQSQFLADLATQEIERGRADAGMLIALEGLPGPTAQETRPLVQEADIALTRAISQLRSIAVYQGDAALAPDWSRAVIEIDTNTATGARLIDPRTHTPIADLGQVGSAIFDPASTRLITEFTDYGDGAAPDRTILRDATTGAVLAELNPNAGARFSAGGRFVINGRAVWSSEEARHLYDLAPGAFVSFDSDEDVALSTRRADQGREFRLRDADTGTTLRKGAVQEISIDRLRESLGLLTFDGVIEIVDFATAETVKTLDLVRLGKSELDIYNLRFVSNGQTLRIMIRQAPDKDWNMIDDRLVEVTEETSFACPPENPPAPDSDDSVCFAAQSADGTRRVEFGDLEILLKDVEGQLISRLEGHPGDISRAIFAPDDSTLLTVTREETHIPYDEFARLWATEDGNPLAVLDHPGQEFQAAYSPSGRQIYTGHSGVTHFWHTKAGGRFPTLRSRVASDLLITDTAGVWASRIAADGSVEIMDFAAVPTRSCKAQLSGPGKFAEFVPNGGTLVVLGEDGHVTAIGSDCQETGTATDTGHGPRGLVVSKDGNRVAVDYDDRVLVLDLPALARVANFPRDEPQGNAEYADNPPIAFNRQGSRLAIPLRRAPPEIGPDSLEVALFDVDAEREIEDRYEASGAVFAPEGSTVLFVGRETGLYDAETGALSRPIARSISASDEITFDPGGRFIVVLSADEKIVQIFETETGALVAPQGERHFYPFGFGPVTFSTDGSRFLVLSSGQDTSQNRFDLYDTASGERIDNSEIGDGNEIPSSAVFGPKDQTIITTSETEILTYDAQSRALLGSTGSPDSIVFGASASTDGTRIIASLGKNYDRIDRISALPFYSSATVRVTAARQLATRCLSAEERRAAFIDVDPPRWCITGPGRESEQDPDRWRPLYPYQAANWRDWLLARDRAGE